MLLISVFFLSADSSQKEVLSKPHSIGESYGGGKVFYTYDRGRHGLIAATVDQAKDIPWHNGVIKHTGSSGDGLAAGLMNTTAILAAQINDYPDGIFAAKVCADYSVTQKGITYGDWYLPSKYELNLLYQKKNAVGFIFDIKYSSYYWSSTETASNTAVAQEFHFGNLLLDAGKGDRFCVRAIRSF